MRDTQPPGSIPGQRLGGLGGFPAPLARCRGEVPGSPLAQSERAQGPGASRGTQLALSFWLGHSAHQQVIKDRLGRSAQRECILAPLDLEPQSCLEFLMPESNF